MKGRYMNLKKPKKYQSDLEINSLKELNPKLLEKIQTG
jgi:hypothetical protein